MDFSTVNWIAVIVAAFSGFVIGGLWYSPVLFGNTWMEAAGLSEEQVRSGNNAKIFGFSFFFLLVMSANLAVFLNTPDITWQSGAFYGFLAGFGWVFFALGIVALFELRSWTYIFVNGGYCVVALTVMGMILGGWR
ncbi:putative integral membrane protein [Luminiphilus syltensis NOR5-1B]|uniref:Putative integral membrane protein n=1 Tax=Luminiphilus syltensis NOR5-1B TaxID=565045 RepID=B8KWS8_9GAMM|nr:DUF1761 domain-containing protein [Luminiphilus syltensis]EED35451.1 putative integral membrane protein [Luminiphilus syltensis NOR5-1B]